MSKENLFKQFPRSFTVHLKYARLLGTTSQSCWHWCRTVLAHLTESCLEKVKDFDCLMCGSNNKWEAFLDPAIESSPADAKYNAADEMESELVPI